MIVSTQYERVLIIVVYDLNFKSLDDGEQLFCKLFAAILQTAGAGGAPKEDANRDSKSLGYIAYMPFRGLKYFLKTGPQA